MIEITHHTPEESRQHALAARQRRCEREPEKCDRGKGQGPRGKGQGAEVPAGFSGIGTCLKEAFGRRWIHAASGCACERIKNELNAMTPEQVTERLATLVEGIYANIDNLEGVIGSAIKAAKAVTPAFMIKWPIRSAVEDCINAARRSSAE